jgi:hypothetical protein
MAEMMNFPDDWHDFIKSNSFVDSKEIYTNGARLMTELRVEQLVEHILREKEQQWVSVKDRLPEKSGTYLCYQPKAADICSLNTVRWSTQLGWMGKEVGSRIEGIEYWMPLPEPPKEDEDD